MCRFRSIRNAGELAKCRGYRADCMAIRGWAWRRRIENCAAWDMMNVIDATREQDADHRFAASAVASFIEDVMTAAGLPAANAAKVAQLMTEADLTGADAHGIF